MIRTSKKQARNRCTNSSFLLCMMITAGLARIAIVAIDDYLPHTGPDSVSQDSVTIRRSLQLVTASIQALLAQHGFAVAAESPESEPGAGDGAGIVA